MNVIMTYCRRIIIVVTVLCVCQQFASAATLQDPTRPPGFDSSNVHVGALDLSAIFISPLRRSAVIDDSIVHVGDQFDGMKVLSIETNKVMLYGPDGNVTLTLIAPVKHGVGGKP
jgi:hypothetical protein